MTFQFNIQPIDGRRFRHRSGYHQRRPTVSPPGKHIFKAKSALTVFVIGLLTTSGCALQNSSPDPSGTETTSHTELNVLADVSSRHGVLGARIGYQVVDLDSGDILTERAPNDLFIPASTVKLPTAVRALSVLGADYRFTTSVFASGKVKDGVLNGDLWLKGGGDPLLTIHDLIALAQQLQDRGLTKITGRFAYDQSALAGHTEINPDQPEAAAYNPGLSALSMDFNRVTAHWRRRGDGTFNTYLSPADGMPPIGRATNDPGPGQAFIQTKDGPADQWLMAPGRLPTESGAENLPVKNPAKRTASVFRTLALRLGLSLPAPVAAPLSDIARPVAAVHSAPLIEILRPALFFSNNMVSELIGLQTTRRQLGRTVGLAESATHQLTWLRSQVSGPDWSRAHLPNHSGLSASARLAPAHLVGVIRHAWRRRYGGWPLIALLPAGGWQNSLAGRFTDPRTTGAVWAKSGTMHYAKGLAGILFTRSGRRAAFALLTTDYKRRQRFDSDPSRLSPRHQHHAKSWSTRAGQFEEEMIQAWINTL